MNPRNFRLVAALAGVGLITTLALLVTMWPDQKKNEEKKLQKNASMGSFGPSEAGARNANSPATANRESGKLSDPKLGIPPATAKEIPNTVSTPPIQESIGTAQIRDPKTGEMKEVPYTLKVMMLRTNDGKPLMSRGVASMVTTDSAGGVKEEPNGKLLDAGAGGTQSRPFAGAGTPKK
ncbi:MAG: hypothetical protein HY286_14680 [Planctomycetes bacterium]|nr:hypothetical protein [Planctomycetota bacterium]